MSGEDFAARLGALEARFRARMAEDAAALDAARGRLAHDPAARVEIGAMAHKLAGLGGTFGLPDVSRAAEAVEAAAEGGAALDEPLDRLIALLRGA